MCVFFLNKWFSVQVVFLSNRNTISDSLSMGVYGGLRQNTKYLLVPVLHPNVCSHMCWPRTQNGLTLRLHTRDTHVTPTRPVGTFFTHKAHHGNRKEIGM